MGSRLVVVVLMFGFLMQVHAEDRRIVVSVKDADSGVGIASRIYLSSSDGMPYYFTSLDAAGSAFRYEKKNWINPLSVEFHTTVSAHPCTTGVPSGAYTLTVERGKTYLPHVQSLTVDDQDLSLDVSLKQWINMGKLGWYSGDLHVHRELTELPNVILAEDLNVVFPLTNWVTLSGTAPSAGDKILSVELPDGLLRVDDQHVIWPRSTEYEIFSVGQRRHTLGALFVLGHNEPLQQTVPPWKPVVSAVRKADPHVLFDMDKLAWPFAMTLPVIAPDATYELVNNHLWRTEFAFREWYTPTPPFIAPPFGATEGGESEWIDFTLGMYYTLLNCGFRMPISAGTANGVHPVPAGFGRVYVHLPGGFEFEAWKRGLQRGNSFVTTGPMLMVSANGKPAGETIEMESTASRPIQLHAEVVSETPVSYGEVVVNGEPRYLLRARSVKTPTGAYRVVVDQPIEVERSGWFAVRFFEDRPGGRVRFAHTAPWFVRVDGQPTKPSWEEREFLISRMQTEIQRSRGVVSESALNEYMEVLQFYRSLPVADDAVEVAMNARPLSDVDREIWLRNMIVEHRFNAQEVRRATGMSISSAQQHITRLRTAAGDRNDADRIRILPYPGGRHPRRGFLDGAIHPQRETKISIFPPWNNGGYAVVDVPEAIFSNLGLTYLAHTHIPTIWTERAAQLEPLEWSTTDRGLEFERTLPNGIAFGSRVFVEASAVKMEMSLFNGTDQPLSGLRSQVCVMLKGLIGFNRQRPSETRIDESLVAIKSHLHDRWLITAWQPLHRAWANPPVPCVHSDPIFPDCDPGEKVKVEGRLWFFEGAEIDAELERLKTRLCR